MMLSCKMIMKILNSFNKSGVRLNIHFRRLTRRNDEFAVERRMYKISDTYDNINYGCESLQYVCIWKNDFDFVENLLLFFIEISDQFFANFCWMPFKKIFTSFSQFSQGLSYSFFIAQVSENMNSWYVSHSPSLLSHTNEKMNIMHRLRANYM